MSLSHFLEFFWAQDLAQGIGRIDGTIDNYMSDVDPLFGEFSVQGLAQHAPPGHRRGMAVVISDLLDSGWHDALRRTSVQHDTLVIEIIDPREMELPDVGVVDLVDPETGRVRELNTSSAKVRAAYTDAALEQRRANAASIREARCAHLVLRTDSDWLFDVVSFVARRKRQAVYAEAAQ